MRDWLLDLLSKLLADLPLLVGLAVMVGVFVVGVLR